MGKGWSQRFLVLDLLRESRLNLSQHKSLRALRFLAGGFPTDPNDTHHLQLINTLLSAVPPSSQLDVVFIYKGFEFSPTCATPPPGHAGYVGESITKSGCECEQCNRNLGRLKVLAEAHWNRDFRLVLSVEASGERAWYTMRALELQVGAQQDDELRWLLSGSSIVSSVPCFASGYT
jgi:hypothetical protein